MSSLFKCMAASSATFASCCLTKYCDSGKVICKSRLRHFASLLDRIARFHSHHCGDWLKCVVPPSTALPLNRPFPIRKRTGKYHFLSPSPSPSIQISWSTEDVIFLPLGAYCAKLEAAIWAAFLNTFLAGIQLKREHHLKAHS